MSGLNRQYLDLLLSKASKRSLLTCWDYFRSDINCFARVRVNTCPFDDKKKRRFSPCSCSAYLRMIETLTSVACVRRISGDVGKLWQYLWLRQVEQLGNKCKLSTPFICNRKSTGPPSHCQLVPHVTQQDLIDIVCFYSEVMWGEKTKRKLPPDNITSWTRASVWFWQRARQKECCIHQMKIGIYMVRRQTTEPQTTLQCLIFRLRKVNCFLCNQL